MRVMVLLKSSISDNGQGPTAAQHAEMDTYNEALINAGIRLEAQGLHPISEGVPIDITGNESTVTDGPFAETKEFLIGYWVWKVDSMDEAVEWAKKVPRGHGTHVELRQMHDGSTPEQEQAVGEEVGTRSA